eukprot:Seg1186.9 transcript_id=Seg1186.9/GoldUCD/mRNA.D3Y31 product="Neuronal acetylcholine receptor subunit alpha-6" protein_id=Seg1186.9/GoldUCD/D3Y31
MMMMAEKMAYLFSSWLCFSVAVQGSLESPATFLVKNLLHNYSKYAKPTLKASSTVDVTFGIELVQIVTIMMPNQVLKSKIWVRMKWTNELLTWNPNDYDGIKSVKLDADSVWTPDIQLYNQFDETESRASTDDNGLLFKTQVSLDHNGATTWNAPATFISTCRLDVSNFPYDTQNCHMKFGPWNNDISSINMTADNLNVVTNTYMESTEWELISATKQRHIVKYECCEYPYSDITINIRVRRKPLFYWFNFVIPYAMLLFSLWVGYFVPPQSSERISLSLTILLAFSILVQATSVYLPRSSELPSLSILYFVVMLEVAFSALITCAIVSVHYRSALGDKAIMPDWLEKHLLQNGEAFFIKLGLLSRYRQFNVSKDVASRPDSAESRNGHQQINDEMIQGNGENGHGSNFKINSDNGKMIENSQRSGNERRSYEHRVARRGRNKSLSKLSVETSPPGSINQDLPENVPQRTVHQPDINELKLRTILKHLQVISETGRSELTSWHLSQKWQRLAAVFDRMFFVVFSIFTIFTFLSFTVFKPAMVA